MQKTQFETAKKTERPSSRRSPAREKVYEEMQDNPLSLKSGIAFDSILPPFIKKVCRNMNSIRIYFFNGICVQSVKMINKSVEKICALC